MIPVIEESADIADRVATIIRVGCSIGGIDVDENVVDAYIAMQYPCLDPGIPMTLHAKISGSLRVSEKLAGRTVECILDSDNKIG